MLRNALFYALLGTFAARPLISETFEPLELSYLQALDVLHGPTPGTTAALDLLILVLATVALALRPPRRAGWPVAAGIGLLVVAVVVSTAAAGDRYLAARMGGHLVCAVLGAAALASLISAEWMRRLVVVAAVGTGFTIGVKCLMQVGYELPETRREWREVYKPQLLRQGFDPHDPLLVNFERRMQAGEATGFLAHANVTASCLMMTVLVLVGLLMQRSAEPSRADPNRASKEAVDTRNVRGPPRLPTIAARIYLVVGALAGLLLLFALYFTYSFGAYASLAIGVLLFAALGLVRALRGVRRQAALLAVLYLLPIMAAVAYGSIRNTLPHPSLAFRWYYWTAGVSAYAEAPLTGIGRGNFAYAYPRYKPPESTEDTRDLHNLWLSLLVEMGPLGLVAGLVLVAWTAWRALCVRNGVPKTDAALRLEGTMAVGLCVCVVQAAFSATRFLSPGVFLVWLQEIPLLWAAGAAIAAGLLHHGRAAAGQWMQLALVAALFATLLHALVDFALLTAGGLALLLLLAVAGATAGPAAAPGARVPRWLLVPGASALCLAQGVVALAALTSDYALRQISLLEKAAAAGGTSPMPLMKMRTLSHDPVVARSAGRALLRLASQAGLGSDERRMLLDRAGEAAREAIRRNPTDPSARALLATIRTQRAASAGQTGVTAAAHAREAAVAWDEAVALSPNDPRLRISAAQAWYEVGQRLSDVEALQKSHAHAAEALRIDDLRPPRDVIRLRPPERQAAEALVRR